MDFIKKAIKYVFGLFIAMFVFGFLSISLIMALVVMLKSTPEEDFSSLAIKTDHAVGVAELTGEILTSEKFEKTLKQFIDNEKIKAVVVRIDSPGGAVGASEEMYRAIKNADTKKPVVCSLGTVAASGGLFAAAGCRKIVANESTLTGSIGVIMMTPNVKNALEKFGVEMNVVKAGKLKDTGSPFRDMTPEDRAYLQSLLDTTHDQFVRIVAEGRKLDPKIVQEVADGRIILGGQAKELGLVDELGGVPEAAKLALSLTGDQAEPEVVRASKPLGVFSMLREMPEGGAWAWVSSLLQPRFLFRSHF